MEATQYKRLRPYPEWKVKQLEEFKKLVQEYPVIGVISFQGIPNSVLYQIRKQLKEEGIAIIKGGKKRIMIKALEEVGLKELAEFIKNLDSPGLVFSKVNAFKLYKILKEKVVKDFAVGGEVAEEDIVVPKGPTNLSPGPVISELARFKIRTRPVGGKLEVIQDVVVCKKGEVISKELASVLRKLGIKARTIRIKLLAAYEDGILFKEDVLAVDPSKYLEDVKSAFLDALYLSLGIFWPCKESIELQVKYLERLARKVGVKLVERGYISKDLIEDAIKEAERIAEALKQKLNLE